MGASLECVVMKRGMAEQVFPLISAHDQTCTLEAWRKRVESFSNGGAGAIVALRDKYARGMLLYEVVGAAVPAASKVFRISAIIVSDLLFADDISHALMVAARQHAWSLGCKELLSPTPGPKNGPTKVGATVP